MSPQNPKLTRAVLLYDIHIVDQVVSIKASDIDFDRGAVSRRGISLQLFAHGGKVFLLPPLSVEIVRLQPLLKSKFYNRPFLIDHRIPGAISIPSLVNLMLSPYPFQLCQPQALARQTIQHPRSAHTHPISLRRPSRRHVNTIRLPRQAAKPELKSISRNEIKRLRRLRRLLQRQREEHARLAVPILHTPFAQRSLALAFPGLQVDDGPEDGVFGRVEGLEVLVPGFQVAVGAHGPVVPDRFVFGAFQQGPEFFGVLRLEGDEVDVLAV